MGYLYLVLLNDVGELSCPDKAVVWRDEQETIAAVEGGRSGLHQPGLHVPSAWCYTGRKKHNTQDRWLIRDSSDYHCQHAWIIILGLLR